jgi:RNA polymerase sigma factor (TIGR02999 family)
MSDSRDNDVSAVLAAAAAGDDSASARLLPLVYDELRKLARARLARTPPGQTLQPTALVHEAYLRLIGGKEPAGGWSGRAHFFFAAARAMRDIIVEQARRKSAQKRGGQQQRVELDDIGVAIDPPSDDVLGIDDALRKLEQEDPENARLVMLRYFTGLTSEEAADVLGVSVATVERRWRFTRAWLRRELAAGPGDPSDVQ